MATTISSMLTKLKKLQEEIKLTETTIETLENKIRLLEVSGSGNAASKGWATRYREEMYKAEDALESLMRTEEVYRNRANSATQSKQDRGIAALRKQSTFTPEENKDLTSIMSDADVNAALSRIQSVKEKLRTATTSFTRGQSWVRGMFSPEELMGFDAAEWDAASAKVLAKAEESLNKFRAEISGKSVSTTAATAGGAVFSIPNMGGSLDMGDEERAKWKAHIAKLKQKLTDDRTGVISTPDVAAPNPVNNGVYAGNVKAVVTELKNAGVSGEALKKIFASLKTQLQELSAAGTQLNESKALGFAGGAGGKFITPTSFKDTDAAASIPLTKIESYNKLTGESRTHILARAEATRRLKEEQKQQASEEQRLINLQAGARNDPTLAPILAQASKKGFPVESLKRIEEQDKTGVRLLNFEKIDPSGVVQKYNATISRLGDVLPEVGRKFRTFGQSVLRDVGELTKWSIAMAVIYGPIQKLSEITSLMIQNEVKLAEATIAVNDKFSSSEKIFNAAALAANNAGEEINTTIAAFTAAYRATGGGADESTRFATAQTLLADSMTLAKLAGMEESQAIDTLSAALRQQGAALTDGSTLLDKWVRTTQVANVDLNTLATGFAVMGETADAAGIDVDKLNGIIATVAETGLASGKEAANSARRVITAFQTPGAIAELQRLGIATEDANGKARSFLEIGQQIYEMSSKGLIAPEAMSNLTLIAGQGVRGQAQLSAVLGNFQRIGQIEAESKGAQGGEAAKALEKQLTTAQTAITRFNNAWQEFAQTLGTKGGLLDLFKGLTNGGTELVKVLNGIAGALGKATPMVTAMTVAMIAFYRKPAETRAQYGQLVSNQMMRIAGEFINPGSAEEQRLAQVSGNLSPETQRRQSMQNFFNTQGKSAGIGGRLGYGAGVGTAAGIATSIIPAAMNYASGDKEKAYADIGGGIAGGIAGALIGGPQGALIGSTIGTSMAEVFLSLTKANIEGWNAPGAAAPIPGAPSNETPEERAKRLGAEGLKTEEQQLLERLRKNTNGIFTAPVMNARVENAPKAQDELQALIDKEDTEGIRNFFAKKAVKQGQGSVLRQSDNAQLLQALGIDQSMALGLSGTGGKLPTRTASDVYRAYSTDKSTMGLLDKNMAAQNALTGATAETKTADYIKSMQATNASAVTKEAISKMAIELSKAFSSGKVKSSVYTYQTGMAAGAASALPVWQTALGQTGADPKKTKELLDVITYGSTEAVNGITDLAQAIIDLQTGVKSGSPEELKARMEGLKEALSSEALNVKLSKTPVRSITGDINAPITSDELALISQRAKGMQKGYYSSEAGGKMSDTDMAAYIEKTFEPAAVPIKDAADLFYKVIEGIDPQFFKEAMDQLFKEGKLKSQESGGIDFQQFKDVDRATLEKLAGQSVTMGQSWQQKFNYGGKAEDQIAIAKDGVAKPLHADFKILAMLLEKLVDQGQKQLDGMFNMPDGANFWVNLAAAQMHMETAAASSNKNMVDRLMGEVGSIVGETKAKPVSTGINYTDKYADRYDKMNSGTRTTTPLSDRLDELSDRKSSGYKTAPERMPNGDMRVSTQPINTTLNLNLKSDTTVTANVLIDAKVVATAIMPFVKQFMASDMVKATSSAGSSTKDYVV